MFGNEVRDAQRRRKELIEAERKRVAEYEQRRQRLQAEYNEATEHIRFHREIERRAAELASELDGTDSLHFHERSAFQQALKEAADPRLVAALAQARRALSEAQRAAPDDVIGHRRAAALLEWIHAANGAIADPGASERDTEDLIRQGQALLGDATHV